MNQRLERLPTRGTICHVGAFAGLLLVVAACGGKQNQDAPLVVGDRQVTPEEVVAGAKAALEQYEQAWTTRNADGLLGLYAESADVALIHQGEGHMGRAGVEAYARGILSKAKEVHLKLGQVSVTTLGADGAQITAVLARSVSDGVTTVDEVGMLSLVLRREGDRWLIVGEHFSYPPRR